MRMYWRFFMPALLYFCIVFFTGSSCEHDRSLLYAKDVKAGDMSFPVLRTSSSHAIRKRSRHPIASSPTYVSSTTQSLNPFEDQFYMPLQIGTPPSSIIVILDTGSELFWIQCQPCLACGQQSDNHPIFDPSNSTSFRNISCSHNFCQSPHAGFQTGCNTNTSCDYSVSYGDNSVSQGALSLETLTVGSTILPNVLFGCGFNNTGIETQLGASGLMGLDLGQHSFTSQIQASKFVYCFPDRFSHFSSTGLIQFGDYNLSDHLNYTPVHPNNFSSYTAQFYYLNLTGISVAGRFIPIDSSVNITDGSGGTIIDSGTTYTRLAEPAFSIFQSAFKAAAGSYLTLQSDACYNTPLNTSSLPAEPQVTLHLQGLDVALRSENIWYVQNESVSERTVCMAFYSVAAGGGNVIGNVQQQNFLIEYDVKNKRVGFAEADCAIEVT